MVHATFLLGAIGGKEAVVPVLTALRWADAYDCDWVLEAIPSICGRLGLDALELLSMMAKDLTSGWYVRCIAMEGMAAIAHRHPEAAERVLEEIGGFLNDPDEDRYIRASAGHILLDFRMDAWRDTLMTFAQMEEARQKEGPFDTPDFVQKDVEEAFNSPGKELYFYTRDWMNFYEPEEIARRQKRWKEEDRKKTREGNTSASVVREGPKIGRNDPCPCGSGKKYKKCCLNKVL